MPHYHPESYNVQPLYIGGIELGTRAGVLIEVGGEASDPTQPGVTNLDGNRCLTPSYGIIRNVDIACEEEKK